MQSYISVFFFFNDTATTEIYTLSLHDALPIFEALPEDDAVLVHEGEPAGLHAVRRLRGAAEGPEVWARPVADRKSTRLNSSHANISYAVFCLKKTLDKHITSSFNRQLARLTLQ